jgi:hypothetical protein
MEGEISPACDATFEEVQRIVYLQRDKSDGKETLHEQSYPYSLLLKRSPAT